jgi:hypothetical protein
MQALELERWHGEWDESDPHARFKAEVALYTRLDPMPALQGLSELTGIPVGALARHVLVRWAASAAEARLALDPVVFRQMGEAVAVAEAEGTDTARLSAYSRLAGILHWLGLADRPTG